MKSIKYLLPYVYKYIHNKHWYKNSNELIKSKYGNDYKLFIKLLAVTSPRNSVKTNTQYAVKVFQYIKDNKPIDFKIGLANKQISNNINKVICNIKPSGVKVNAFIASLNLIDNSVCIDTWMLKAFNINRRAPTPKDIRVITHRIKTLASITGLKTYEVQACLWVYAKTELNNTYLKESYDFAHYL
jgi:hypothetical protein